MNTQEHSQNWSAFDFFINNFVNDSLNTMSPSLKFAASSYQRKPEKHNSIITKFLRCSKVSVTVSKSF